MEQANSVDEFLKILSRYENKGYEIFFRGQSEQFLGSLKPKIIRIDGLLENESNMITDIINMCHEEFINMVSSFEILSKAQHYSLPTRLLDLTIEPLVALYFAVQDYSKSQCSGNVYVYIQSSLEYTDPKIRAISLLAKYGYNEIDQAIEELDKELGKHITLDDFYKLVSNSQFVKFSQRLEDNNPRFAKQKGSFYLATNKIFDKIVQPNLSTLDDIEPNMIIRIPYEFKREVLEELNTKWSITEYTMFPELPMAAIFIENKYRLQREITNFKYSFSEPRDISLKDFKRSEIVVTLEDQYRFAEIKRLAKTIAQEKVKSLDEVWIKVARNSDDFISKNYIIEGKLRKMKDDVRFLLRPLPYIDDDGFTWRENKAFTVLNDYFQEFLFDSDNRLFAYHYSVWNEVVPIFNQICEAKNRADWEKLSKIVQVTKDKILDDFCLLQDFGRSHSPEFDEFLNTIGSWFCELDKLKDYISDAGISQSYSFSNMKKVIDKCEIRSGIIGAGFNHWIAKLNISKDEIDANDPREYRRPKFVSKQTIPTSEDAIDVWFEIRIEFQDSHINLNTSTNLYNAAELLVSITNNDGTFYTRYKSIVENGHFIANIGEKASVMKGVYNVSISLSLPSLQDTKFIDLAGTEYENLRGSFIKRDGIGPFGSFDGKVTIE